MKQIFTSLTLAASLALSAHSLADERVDHFKGLPSPDLATAVKNFTEYNDLLAEQLSGEITPVTMAEVHRLTYTIEAALEKISDELEELAETLEEIHIASETVEPETMTAKGKEYLKVTEELKKL